MCLIFDLIYPLLVAEFPIFFSLQVNTVVEKVIWQCLLEDTSLFLRYIFEKLTRVPHKDDLISVIRKIVVRLPELPMHTAHILFNNLVS